MPFGIGIGACDGVLTGGEFEVERWSCWVVDRRLHRDAVGFGFVFDVQTEGDWRRGEFAVMERHGDVELARELPEVQGASGGDDDDERDEDAADARSHVWRGGLIHGTSPMGSDVKSLGVTWRHGL